jgi:hypothetical protein
VNIEFAESFYRGFSDLPASLQRKSHETVDRFLQAFESRRFPKGLRVHKCGPFISLSVSMNIRVFVLPIAGGVRFVFLGDHEDADRYLRK